jgi:hypothetical protein
VQFENLSTDHSYELQRSSLGLDNFLPVGPAAVPSAATQSFLDAAPTGEKAFYRLKMAP